MIATLSVLSSQQVEQYSERNEDRIARQSIIRDSLIAHEAPNEEIIRANFDLAWTHLNFTGEYKSAEPYYESAMALFDQQTNHNLLAESYIINGRILQKESLYNAALESFKKALKIREVQSDTARMSIALRLIGKTLIDQKSFEASIPFLEKSLELKLTSGNENPHILFSQLASSYMEIGNLKLAKKYLAKAFNAAEKLNKYKHYESFFIKSGQIAIQEHKIDSALYYLKRAYNGLTKHGGAQGQFAKIDICLSNAYLAQNKLDSALMYADSGLEKAIKYGFLDYEISAYKLMSKVYEKRGDYRSSQQFMSLFARLQDSIFRNEEIKKNLDFQRKWDLEEKEQKIRLLHLRNQSTIKELALRKRWNALLLATTVLLSILLIITVIFLKYKSALSKQLFLKEEEIEKERLNRIRLKALIEGQETERERVARELHDGLGGMLSASSLGDNTTIKSNINSCIEELRRITDNLLPISLETLGLKSAIEDLIGRSFENPEQISFEMQEELNLRPNIEKEIYRIVQELIVNGLRHSQAKKFLIQIFGRNEIKIIYEDDGIGFDPTLNNRRSGLKNIEARIGILGGEYQLDTFPNKGFAIYLSIPNKK